MDKELIPIWNFDMLPKTREDSIKWAQEQGLLPSGKTCRRHQIPMTIRNQIGVAGQFACTRSHSCPKRCVANNTIFEICRMPLYRAIRLMYAFAHDWQYKVAQHEIIDLSIVDEEILLLGSDTINHWYHNCREIVVDHFSKWDITDEMIGGPDIVIQIDESPFGERKFNRRSHLNNHWALFMTEKDSECVRLVISEDGNANTVLQNILKHVKPGSTILTDHWESFDGLNAAGYVHKRAYETNLEHRLKDCTRKDTKGIDNVWIPFKVWFRGRHIGKGQFTDFLCLFIWHQYCEKYGIDPFQSLLQAVRESPMYKICK